MSARPRIAIIGAGGHGRVLLDAVLAGASYDVAGFVDDDPSKAEQQILGFPVLGPSAQLSRLAGRYGFTGVALAIGDNYLRQEKLLQARAEGLKPISVTHPTAYVSRFAELGEAVVVLAGAIVNPGAVIEENVCINTAASIDHDNHLHAHCHIYPGATLAGTVEVGEFSYIGSGATVIPNIRVGKYAFVAAGATVIRDVAEGLKVAGVPARQIGIQQKRPASMRRAGGDSA